MKKGTKKKHIVKTNIFVDPNANKKKYLALDTNMVAYLAEAYKFKMNAGKNMRINVITKRYFNEFNKILESAQRGEIKFFIPNMVYFESQALRFKNGIENSCFTLPPYFEDKTNYLDEFFKDFCVFDKNVASEDIEQECDLVKRYTENYAITRRSIIDGIVAAQSSLKGLNLATKNEADLVSKVKGDKLSKEPLRSMKIQEMNFIFIGTLNFKVLKEVPYVLPIRDLFLENGELDLSKVSFSLPDDKISIEEYEKILKENNLLVEDTEREHSDIYKAYLFSYKKRFPIYKELIGNIENKEDYSIDLDNEDDDENF